MFLYQWQTGLSPLGSKTRLSGAGPHLFVHASDTSAQLSLNTDGDNQRQRFSNLSCTDETRKELLHSRVVITTPTSCTAPKPAWDYLDHYKWHQDSQRSAQESPAVGRFYIQVKMGGMHKNEFREQTESRWDVQEADEEKNSFWLHRRWFSYFCCSWQRTLITLTNTQVLPNRTHAQTHTHTHTRKGFAFNFSG